MKRKLTSDKIEWSTEETIFRILIISFVAFAVLLGVLLEERTANLGAISDDLYEEKEICLEGYEEEFSLNVDAILVPDPGYLDLIPPGPTTLTNEEGWVTKEEGVCEFNYNLGWGMGVFPRSGKVEISCSQVNSVKVCKSEPITVLVKKGMKNND